MRSTGIVKWFNNSKGYGFILGDDGEEYFLHYSALQMDGFRTTHTGAKVEFTPIPGNQGTTASEVTINATV